MDRYRCGCPAGTPILWRDRKGIIVIKGSLNAVKFQCKKCKKLQLISDVI